METKICKNCNEEKPINKFKKGKRRNGEIFIQPKCSSCQYKIWKNNKLNGINHLSTANLKICSETQRVLARICSKCNLEKKVDDFSKDSRNKSGIAAECKSCVNARNRKPPKPVYTDVKACIKCGEKKPLFSFPKYKTKSGITNYCAKCNSCKNDSSFATYRPYTENGIIVKFCTACKNTKPLEDFQKSSNRWICCKMCNLAASLAYTARKKGAKFSLKFNKADVIKRDGLACYLCNDLLTEKSATIEHLIPLSRGGNHTLENCKIACVHCNCSKGNKTLSEFKKWRGDYSRFQTKIRLNLEPYFII